VNKEEKLKNKTKNPNHPAVSLVRILIQTWDRNSVWWKWLVEQIDFDLKTRVTRYWHKHKNISRFSKLLYHVQSVQLNQSQVSEW